MITKKRTQDRMYKTRNPLESKTNHHPWGTITFYTFLLILCINEATTSDGYPF